MADTYTVQPGDSLSEIAAMLGTTVSNLVGINNITDPNYIVVGQELNLKPSSSSSTTQTLTSRATIKVFGLQTNTDRTMYATWNWGQSNTQNYQVMWYYDTGDGVWFIGNDSTVEEKQSIYSAPSNALRVKFKVKPIAESGSANKTSTALWTANWSTEQIYDFSNNPPTVPSVPSISIDKYKLTAKLDNLNVNATHIQFQVVRNDTTVYTTGTATIQTSSASFVCTIAPGSEYKIRCRSYRDGVYSNWSNYSSTVGTMPLVPSGITTLRATSETSVYLEWSVVATATKYDIEYATKKEYFDRTNMTTTSTGIEFTHFEMTGLESGLEYFFRVRAVNSDGESPWSGIRSIVIGTKPAAPTTWSSTTTVVTGEALKLYWMHNTEDGSSQVNAELELYFNDVKEVLTIKNSTDEDEKDKTSVYSVDTSTYTEGTKIKWRVRTSGITGEYGDWSIERTVDIYAPVSLEFSVLNVNNETFDTLESYPIYISALGGPDTQTPVGYHLTVTANESYETIDRIGNHKMVSKGEQVYSKYFDVSGALRVTLSAGNIDLENNINYKITCLVSMNSGLTKETSVDFSVAWTDDIVEPTAEIGIDKDTLAAYIRPYCEKTDVTLSVYRREFDGTFTELITGVDNSSDVFVTDPHPALDYARYRIVAVSNDTGAVSYYDVPGYAVGEKAVVIQWGEEWTNFDTTNSDELAQPVWSGSMLKLPYNVDISDSNSADISLIEYAGRKHPVSYYGTQIGQSSTWNVTIPKADKETLYALRRLARWMGDVYVREPSGSGYWASISVSFSQKHCDVTIPVSFNVTRVEGGI